MSKIQNTQSLADPDPEVQFFCGFDWARNDHYFVLKTRSHQVLHEGYFQNTASGFRSFFESLDVHRHGQTVALIIESNRTSALTLLGMKEWITLYPVNPAVTRKLIELEGSGPVIVQGHRVGPEAGDRRDDGWDLLVLRQAGFEEDRGRASRRSREAKRRPDNKNQACPRTGLQVLLRAAVPWVQCYRT